MKKSQEVTYNVVTIKWGTKYTHIDVNRTYEMVKKNTSFNINLYCLTDITEGLNPDIKTYPLPKMNMDIKECKYVYRKEAGLCDNNLGDLNGKRVLFLDLDTIITGNIDSFFTLPKDDEFYIINDWNTKGDHIGQASCYSWRVGTLGYVKEHFEKHPRATIKKFHTASQAYLSSKVIEKYGKLYFWPDNWSRSFRFHCLPAGVLRRFIDPKLPKGTKILAFHGNPKIENAIVGEWSGCGKVDPLWKKVLYKNLRPAPWIQEYY
jgi:hypothetical protein